ncbi:MAG TPA: hypothetical protein PKY35_03600 [Candidatus Hydrogenedentes bacterium]|nr:hypothetical protein [Candidatus Hydrogenedentota bacterium]HOL76089.1 hypothetical protein [Candidatus Hydrogenedentota bacterium]HPO84703.1 hypothetical protein [Candidatus Hydrogenedentota bacterium]
MSGGFANRRPSRVFFVTVVIGWLGSVSAFCWLFSTGDSRLKLEGWDEQHYYAYARSLAIDGDLDFSNEYEYFYGNSAAGDSPNLSVPPTPTGLRPNRYPAGMGLLLAPLVWLAHGLTWTVNLFCKYPMPYDGWAPTYLLSYCLGSITLAWFGITLTWQTLSRMVGFPKATIAVFSMFFGTNLFYYLVFQPGMAHAVSTGLAGCYMYVLVRYEEKHIVPRAVLLGLLNGIMGAVRYTDALIGLMFGVYELLPVLFFAEKRQAKNLLQIIKLGLYYLGGFLTGIAPQVLVWKTLTGSFLANTYAGYSFHWFQPAVIQSLFSTRNSLFFYSPLVLWALWGMLRGMFGQYMRLFVSGLFFFVALVYVNMAWSCWWFGASFGARAMLSCWPIWTAGLAWQLKTGITSEKPYLQPKTWATLGIIVLCISWTLLLAMLFHFCRISHEEGFTWHEFMRAVCII